MVCTNRRTNTAYILTFKARHLRRADAEPTLYVWGTCTMERHALLHKKVIACAESYTKQHTKHTHTTDGLQRVVLHLQVHLLRL